MLVSMYVSSATPAPAPWWAACGASCGLRCASINCFALRVAAARPKRPAARAGADSQQPRTRLRRALSGEVASVGRQRVWGGGARVAVGNHWVRPCACGGCCANSPPCANATPRHVPRAALPRSMMAAFRPASVGCAALGLLWHPLRAWECLRWPGAPSASGACGQAGMGAELSPRMGHAMPALTRRRG